MRGFVTKARLLIGAVLGLSALVALPTSSQAARGRAARSANLSETAHLHRTSSGGVHLNEQGNASGTLRGKIYLHLKISEHHVTAEVNIYPQGGSLTATGTASYHVNGGFAPFSGTITVARGTGIYAHAHSGALRFTGSIQRSNDNVTVQLSGRLSY